MTREKAILDFVRSRRKVGDGWVSWHDIRKHGLPAGTPRHCPLFRSIGVLVGCGVVEEQGRGHGPALVRAKETAE